MAWRQCCLAAAVALAFIAAMTRVQANTFDALVVFGDSLSDVGNAGRFSNGPVWVEHLATHLGVKLQASELGGLNYAVGGARLDPGSGAHNLRTQADRYLAHATPSAGTLYVVFGGGNDLLAAVQHPQPAALLRSAVASISSIVADLTKAGARRIMVPNLPDVGITPAVAAYGERAIELARQVTKAFNDEVDRALAEFSRVPEVKLYRFDVWSLAEQVRGNPRAFGFDDIRTPCAGFANCEGYLFWDQVHPTAQAHGQLGGAAFETVRAGMPASSR